MNILIFAGGAGTRLWPLSRRNSPKQFSVLKGDQSTLQMTFDRVLSFGLEHIFLATNEKYRAIVRAQVPHIHENNIFFEPARRDLAAAVGLALIRLQKRGVKGSTAIVWSDHFVEKPEAFESALRVAEEFVRENPKKMVFFGEHPRFANHNLGWINVGAPVGGHYRSFAGWKYRPEKSVCDEMFANGDWLWNPGYFVFDIETMADWYAQFQPELWTSLQTMVGDPSALARDYETLPALSFDEAIVERISQGSAVVMPVDLGWSDPGTLYALKEALEPDAVKNFTKGFVVTESVRDSFVYNEEDKKIVTVIGLEGIIVVNTGDALLVCHKDEVPRIKDLLKKIEGEHSEYL